MSWSDLSRTLTEAATNAIDKSEAEVYAGRRLARADLRYMAEAAVAAVLETLAADERKHRFDIDELHVIFCLAHGVAPYRPEEGR